MANIQLIKNQLSTRLEELIGKAHQIDDTLHEPRSADWEEHATESEEDEVLEDMGNHILAEISEINGALLRMEAGTYGTCTHCGDAINDNRLSAVPHAAHCVKCAALSET